MTSKTSKHTRRRVRRARKTTERPTTAAEREEAIRTLLDGGQYAAVKAGHFCERERDLPIAGTPRPAPCPFCGKTEVFIAIETNQAGNTSAHVECDVCGAEAPYACEDADAGITGSYAIVLRAAKLWNARAGTEHARSVVA